MFTIQKVERRAVYMKTSDKALLHVFITNVLSGLGRMEHESPECHPIDS